MAEAPFDAGDPKAVEKQKKAALLREQQRKVVMAGLLASPEGRDWLWQLLIATHAFDERVALSNGQYEQGFYNGQREIGLNLLRALAKSSPQNFAIMISEQDTAHG